MKIILLILRLTETQIKQIRFCNMRWKGYWLVLLDILSCIKANPSVLTKKYSIFIL